MLGVKVKVVAVFKICCSGFFFFSLSRKLLEDGCCSWCCNIHCSETSLFIVCQHFNECMITEGENKEKLNETRYCILNGLELKKNGKKILT